jgi:hypothetical protein
MRVSERLRRTFWFLTGRGRATRRWSHEQKLQQAEAFDRVIASGSVSAARAALERERAEAAALLARRRVGLLEENPVFAAAREVVYATKPDLTVLLDYLAANPAVAAALDLDVTKPELLAVRLASSLDRPMNQLDRPMNQSTSGARLSSSR